MRLRPFLLDQWLDHYAAAALPYNLAGSTGPAWTIDELLDLEPGSSERLLRSPVAYQPSAGRPALREALADMSGVPAEEILVMAGASEALFHVFFLSARPGANVVVPSPAFPTYHALPEALGLELRTYDVLAIDAGCDIDAIKAASDANTRLILVNTPHNPTGAIISASSMRELHDFAVSRHIQLASDEVFHPIYHGSPGCSASVLPHATVIGDLSKAFALPGLRVGWIREPDAERRAQYINAREYLSVSTNVAGEVLAEIAVTHRRVIHDRTQRAASANLARLDEVMRAKASVLQWSRPRGGTTAFLRINGLADTRPFCTAAAEQGLLLVPGDCFGVPDHVRIGLGVAEDLFDAAMRRLQQLL
jgi:aspartate/methionine/tyrosine aminotransferase